ncbi:hypothetical protein EPUS_08575 [Endocarpon pusillum Z07020]|uniref:HNH nuclease domain-containing protein n=1 Tax=Endocarpon pusillum (strain Z07020 / HMAS-L-300199) TaxID=1263415 RepID=U1G8K2_ENDPU|nr:uncharacterized protein EPUS_08575 [Endocarpon pusillum Z07020]ERF73777.1 hypothetical protein EPUS_08575 [Endocarpon pusillum Z07020]
MYQQMTLNTTLFPAKLQSPLFAHDGKSLVSGIAKEIKFHHPRYRAEAQTFLILPACDENDTIDHEIARAACAIIACNPNDGFFTTDEAGANRVTESQLPYREEGYFFQAPSSDQPYPVFPSFRRWYLPNPGQLPSPWNDCRIPLAPDRTVHRATDASSDILARDKTCRMTAFALGTETAHIVPKAEKEWMYSKGRTDDGGNDFCWHGSRYVCGWDGSEHAREGGKSLCGNGWAS